MFSDSKSRFPERRRSCKPAEFFYGMYLDHIVQWKGTYRVDVHSRTMICTFYTQFRNANLVYNNIILGFTPLVTVIINVSAVPYLQQTAAINNIVDRGEIDI